MTQLQAQPEAPREPETPRGPETPREPQAPHKPETPRPEVLAHSPHPSQACAGWMLLVAIFTLVLASSALVDAKSVLSEMRAALHPPPVIVTKYIGCFKDSPDHRALPFLALKRGATLAQCLKLARDKGFVYASVQHVTQECWLGNDVSRATGYGTADTCVHMDEGRLRGEASTNAVYSIAPDDNVPRKTVRDQPGRQAMMVNGQWYY